MRAITAAVIWALVVEVLLGLAFLAGYHWIGGWQMGTMLAGLMLLLMALPWLGELRARYDSADGSVRATVGWWGKVAITQKPEPILEVRVCGIPWRKKLGSKKPEEERPRRAGAEPTSDEGEPRQFAKRTAEPPGANGSEADVSKGGRWRGRHIDDITRAATAALAAGNDLLWDAREVYFRIDAPAENAAYDDVIARIVAHRGVGPVDVKVRRGDGKRRIRARYSIGLFRAGAIVMCMAAQGRVWSLRQGTGNGEQGTVQQQQTASGNDEGISDEELIRDLTETTKRAGDEDGV